MALFKAKKQEPIFIGQASVETRGAGMSIVHHECFINDELMLDRLRAVSTISAWANMLRFATLSGRDALRDALFSDLFDANQNADEAETWEGVSIDLAPEVATCVMPQVMTMVCEVILTPDSDMIASWEVTEDSGEVSPEAIRVACLALYEQSLRTMDTPLGASILFVGMRLLYGFLTDAEHAPHIIDEPREAASAIFTNAVDFVASQVRNGD